MDVKDRLTPDPERGENTSATGAAVGAALGALAVWLLERVPALGDIPSPIEGAVVVIAVYFTGRLLPPVR